MITLLLILLAPSTICLILIFIKFIQYNHSLHKRCKLVNELINHYGINIPVKLTQKLRNLDFEISGGCINHYINKDCSECNASCCWMNKANDTYYYNLDKYLLNVDYLEEEE